jgi:hypothetical protein
MHRSQRLASNAAAGAARGLNYVGHHRLRARRQGRDFRAWSISARSRQRVRKADQPDGPAREVIRNNDLVRCYYPDAKIMSASSRDRSATLSPSLLPQQLNALAAHYYLPLRESSPASPVWKRRPSFSSPRTGLRYGHKFWADIGHGLLLKARAAQRKERADRAIRRSPIFRSGAKLDRDLVKPSFAVRACRLAGPGIASGRSSAAGNRGLGGEGSFPPVSPKSSRDSVHCAAKAPGGAHGLFGRLGRRLGVRRGRATRAAACRSVRSNRAAS